MLELRLRRSTEATKQLRGELFRVPGQDVAGKAERITKETKGFVRYEVKEVEIRKQGIQLGDS